MHRVHRFLFLRLPHRPPRRFLHASVVVMSEASTPGTPATPAEGATPLTKSAGAETFLGD